MTLYTAYGLTIRSELELPELVVAPGCEHADIEIRLGRVPCGEEASERPLAPGVWANRDSLRFQIPGTATYHARDGRTITIEPAAGSDDDSVRLFLLGSAFGALLFQRGALILHGSAIRVDDACLICLGPSGIGKFTLLAGFLQRGHQIVSDDVIAVDEGGRAIPGFPRVKLWQDAADRLGIQTGPLRRIRPELEKFNYPLGENFADRPWSVRWVYVLGSHEATDIRIEPLSGMRRLAPLRDNTYRAGFLKGLKLEAEHLRSCAKLANAVHLARVTRPRSGFDLNALIDRLLADASRHATPFGERG
ncbi:MAG: hypothetical protein KGK30_09895, partial [Elusimicrobia bacterium]|nr:hypothetical protein [Elusimicrobiota bacterium]